MWGTRHDVYGHIFVSIMQGSVSSTVVSSCSSWPDFRSQQIIRRFSYGTTTRKGFAAYGEGNVTRDHCPSDPDDCRTCGSNMAATPFRVLCTSDSKSVGDSKPVTNSRPSGSVHALNGAPMPSQGRVSTCHGRCCRRMLG